MSIEFTQYLMPNGRREQTFIDDMPAEIEAMADQFIAAGGRYESEMLRDYAIISLTACYRVGGEEQDVEIEICKNGPDVPGAVERLIRKSVAWLRDRQAP